MKFVNQKNSQLMTRIGLGLFFLAFGALKLVKGRWFMEGPYQAFYGIGFPLMLIFVVGVVQVAMSVSFFTNAYTRLSAWIATVMLGATIIATLPKILTLFQLPPASPPPGFLFFTAIPVFFMALSEAMKVEKHAPQEAPKEKVHEKVIEKEEVHEAPEKVSEKKEEHKEADEE